MDIPEKILFAAERLRQGHRVNRITVRDFLRHFDTERRGSAKVQAIRAVLNSLDLATDPDFETAWIDEPIRLRLNSDPYSSPAYGRTTENHGAETSDDEELVLAGTPSAVEQAEAQSAIALTSTEPEAGKNEVTADNDIGDDPTFRIGSLPAANKKLIAVNQQDSLTKTITLMLQYDFGQLPVMHGEREVKGMVTWKSIGSKLALGVDCKCVEDCREEARIVDSNRTLFDAIPTIVDFGYVLVRNQRDRRITGIVTASDLSLQFQSLAEPFLLLREIELHVRQLLASKLTKEDYRILDTAPPPAEFKPQDINDLTLGQYIRLFQHPQVWEKLNLRIDAAALTAQLDEVRIIRNDVMHFDPDPMTKEQLHTLKQAVHFLQSLYELLP